MFNNSKTDTEILINENEIKHILCPIDFSPESRQALRYAVALARAYDAKLYLLHCSEESLPDGGMRVQEHFQEMLAPFTGSSDPLIWQGIVSEGKSGIEITREASKYQIDLIVMYSRRRPFAAALLGSTAELVCRTAPCPVMIIHPHEREWIDESSSKLLINRVLVGYNYTRYADLALACGISLAKEYDCELHILRVLPSESTHSEKPAQPETFQKEIDQLLARIPAKVRAEVNIKPVILEGSSYKEILSYSETHRIDLICLGRHTETDKPLHGSTADRVVRDAICPVMIACPQIWNQFKDEETHNKRVLIAYDGSPCSNIALRDAAERIWPAGTELRVISVMEPLATLGPTETHYRLSDEVFSALEKLSIEAAATLAGKDRLVSHVVRTGMAAEMIIAEAQHWQADIILLGTHSRRGLSRLLLGSVAEHVAAKAPCSVEIARLPEYAAAK